MRILVLGAGGMLGSAVARESRTRGVETLAAVRHRRSADDLEANLAEPSQVIDLVERSRPQVVINCAGIVPEHPGTRTQLVAVNALMPHVVAERLDTLGGRLVHVSTDCVFSGSKGGYTDLDEPDPIGPYGTSKALGEVRRDRHLTVRTSFIGRDQRSRRGLVEWLLRQRGLIPGYRNAIWSGLTCPILASVLVDLALDPPALNLVHVAGDAIDKCTLLTELARLFELSVEVVPSEEPRIDRSLRPSGSIRLDLPPIREQLLNLLDEPLP